MPFDNGVMLQFFQWYSPRGVLWNRPGGGRGVAGRGRVLVGLDSAGRQGRRWRVRRRLRHLRSLRSRRVRPEGHGPARSTEPKTSCWRRLEALRGRPGCGSTRTSSSITRTAATTRRTSSRSRSTGTTRNRATSRLADHQGLDRLQLSRPRRRPLEHEVVWWWFDGVSYDHNHPERRGRPGSSSSNQDPSRPTSATSTATTTT